MKQPHLRRLRDILETIDLVTEIVDGLNLGAYRRDVRTQKAVERCIEIISEASRHVPEVEKERFPEIPWPDIAGVGNLLRHEYQRVADEVIWRTVARSLPQLRAVVARLLEERR